MLCELAAAVGMLGLSKGSGMPEMGSTMENLGNLWAVQRSRHLEVQNVVSQSAESSGSLLTYPFLAALPEL